MAKNSCADELARELAAARVELRRAAQVLHDDAGSLLAVAGLRLQLLRMDHPEAEAQAGEVGSALDGVMEHLRRLSRELEPSPVRRTGLKNALLDLAEASREATGADIHVRYTATAVLSPAAADAVYHAIASAVAAAGGKQAGRVTIAVSGTRLLSARVSYAEGAKNGRRTLATAALLAAHSGIVFDVEATKSGTIVSIRHAIQRPSRG